MSIERPDRETPADLLAAQGLSAFLALLFMGVQYVEAPRLNHERFGFYELIGIVCIGIVWLVFGVGRLLQSRA